MRQLLLFIVFAAAVASVGYVAVNPVSASYLAERADVAARLERELGAAAGQELQESGLTWSSVEMDGQIAVLTGEAPREEERAEAIAAVRRATGPGGVLRGGVMAVRDLTTIAPPVSPYEWRAVRSGERVTLVGAIPTRSARAELVTYAGELFPGGVADQMIIARGAPDETAWIAVARTAVAQLATLEDGNALLRDSRVTIEGRASDGVTRNRVTAALSHLPAPFLAAARVEAPEEAGAAPAPPLENGETVEPITDVDVCRDVFGALMEDVSIDFAVDEPAIAKESYPLLDQLAIAAIRCQGVIIRIEGGGEPESDASAFTALGLSRAQSVADYFILKGIAQDRLEPLAQTSSERDEPAAPEQTTIVFALNP